MKAAGDSAIPEKILRTSFKTIAPVLALLFPAAAFANLTGTPTLAANTALSLDTGTTSASGGDILWTGTAITPQGKATAYNVGALGASAFGVLTQQTLSGFSLLYTSASIPASALTAGDVFAVKTNGGNYAAVLVTAVSGASITVQFTTFGVTSGPNITQVLNNFSYIPAGFANSGIAPGSLFVIVGTQLASPTATAVLQSSAGAGLPTTLNGSSVKVTVNGTSVTPAFYYAIAGALALVMPSNTPLGSGQVTVSYNNQTSAPYTIQVTQSAMGFDSYYGSGSGLGVATNPLTGALYSYSNSIPPGTTVTLWGSGLGADPARDTTYTPAAFAINNLAHVYVGGVDAAILYQGASGFPGVNQVNITVPASAPTGCNVSLVGVTSGGVPTNFTSLPIGSGACSDPSFGPLGGQVQTLTGQSTVKIGELIVEHTTSQQGSAAPTVNDTAVGSFQSYTGLSASSSSSGTVSLGSCVVTQALNATGAAAATTTGLDPGTLTVTGPTNASATLSGFQGAPAGTYFASLPSGFVPSTGGTFSFHGGGGANVGAFNASLTLPNPLLNWTNQSAAATITRSAGLPIAWTGGGSGSYVSIFGSSVSSDNSTTGSFTCTAPVAAGQLTVPAYVLGALPAGTGSVTVSNGTYGSFSATGLDIGLTFGEVAFSVNSTVK
jgi:uncharacterized protein (TIGR03437 family)